MILNALNFDFGGVLTSDLWESVLGYTRRAGLPENAVVDLLHNNPEIRRPFHDVEAGRIGQLDFERRLAAAAAGLPAEGLLGRMCEDLRPDEPVWRAVERLRATGVLSNTWSRGYFDPYDGYDLEHRVDAVILSDQVGMRKPEPAIFRLMCDKIGAAPAEAVFIDDVGPHLPNAAALGMTVVHQTDCSPGRR